MKAECAELRTELDTAYFHLYGVAHADAETMFLTFTKPDRCPETNADRSRVYGKPEVQAK